MIERFQIFQLTVPTLPVGGVTEVPLPLESDAPFAVRRVKSRNIGLNGWRFMLPDKSWQSDRLRTDWTVPHSPLGVFGSNPYPTPGAAIYPELIYPANSQILVDIGNASGAPITNARLTFYGSKLFRDGAIAAPTYPEKMSALPFNYKTDVFNVGLALSSTVPFELKDLQLRNLWDADYSVYGGVCDARYPPQQDGGVVGPGTSFANTPGNDPVQPTFGELYIMLRNESRKAYMNEPIHADDLFGRAVPSPGGAASSNFGAPPQFPGLFTPEIYLERNCSLYFDLFRFDTTGVPLDLRFRWLGAKVFHR